MQRNLPWPDPDGSPYDSLDGFTREEIVARAINKSIRKREVMQDVYEIESLIEMLKKMFNDVLKAENQHAEIIEILHKTYCPNSSIIFMNRIYELLSDNTLPFWKIRGLFSIGLLKLCEEIDTDLPCISTKVSNFHIAHKLKQAIEKRKKCNQ